MKKAGLGDQLFSGKFVKKGKFVLLLYAFIIL